MADQLIVRIHPQAPPKPTLGAPCNGCGVCCLVEPCPLGMVLSLKTQGACRMLRWQEGPGGAGLYRCGALALPVIKHVARRWIAAGRGCDCSLEDSRSLPAGAPQDGPRNG